MTYLFILYTLHVMLKMTNAIETAIALAWVLLRRLFEGGAYFEIQPKVRRLFEGGAYSSNYGNDQCDANIYNRLSKKMTNPT